MALCLQCAEEEGQETGLAGLPVKMDGGAYFAEAECAGCGSIHVDQNGACYGINCSKEHKPRSG